VLAIWALERALIAAGFFGVDTGEPHLGAAYQTLWSGYGFRRNGNMRGHPDLRV